MATVTALVSIAVSLLAAGISINQLHIASKNQSVRSVISSIMKSINSEINKGRLSINKALALLQSKNQNALMNYLQNNPVISRNLQGIQADSDLIASLQSEQASLEAEIASLQNELSSYGYSQTGQGSDEERKRVAQTESKLKQATKKYDDLAKRAEGVTISTTNPIRVYTADIDARSQNINGGLKQ